MSSQITRPDSDQLKFTSSKTGDWILEDYLESAEIGNKTLSNLLSLIFDTSGTPLASLSADNAAVSSAKLALFEEKFLGSKSSVPTVNNTGGALAVGSMYWDSSLGSLRIYTGSAWVATAIAAPVAVTVSQLSGNGSQTVFTLSSAPPTQNACEVFISGVAQTTGVDYTVVGTALTFASAPPSGANNIFIRVLSPVSAGVPSDGSVAFAQLSSAIYGTSGANVLLRLDSLGRLPAIDGSQLTGVVAQQAGEVCFFAMSTPPTGFLKANGAAVSRSIYSALFTAIGIQHGAGNGTSTFNVPDLRGEFIRGWDDGRGVDSGRAFGSTQTDAMQGHRHTLGRTSFLNSGIPGGGNDTTSTPGNTGDPTSDGTNGSPRTAAETRPRNVAILACIKY
jgi:microcystin-dependent protein